MTAIGATHMEELNTTACDVRLPLTLPSPLSVMHSVTMISVLPSSPVQESVQEASDNFTMLNDLGISLPTRPNTHILSWHYSQLTRST